MRWPSCPYTCEFTPFGLAALVISLTARRILVWCLTWLHLPSARYKDAFVPRCFSNNSLPPFSSLHSPYTTPAVSEASVSFTFPCMLSLSTERYDENNPSATACFDSLDAFVALSYRSSDCGLDLRVTGDVVTQRPEMPCLRYPPPSLLNESTAPPYFPTVVDHAASAC